MRLLMINPNTSPAITTKMLAVARAAVPPGVKVVGVAGRFGARYISSRAAAAIAAHAALDALARHRGAYDAVVLACFGDPGLAALRELAAKPVVGMAEASILSACLLGGRFAIVTGGARWVPMLEEFVAAQGLGERLASVRAVSRTGAAIAANPAAALRELAATCLAAVEEDGAEAVILGGAGLAGLARRLQPLVPVPLIDSVVAAAQQAAALAAFGPEKALRGSFAPAEPVAASGLSPALRNALRHGRLALPEMVTRRRRRRGS